MNCDNCNKQDTVRCPIRGIMSAGTWASNQVEADGVCCVWEEVLKEAA